jgi:hypothetical protein
MRLNLQKSKICALKKIYRNEPQKVRVNWDALARKKNRRPIPG